MSQILVPHSTAKGGLFSITDSTPRYPKGCVYEDVDKYGRWARFEYLYNAIGASAKAGVFYLKDLGAGASSPSVDGLTVTSNEVGELAIAQADIPSTYWGWYLTAGRSAVSGVKMYWDSVDYNGTDACTDGHAITITDGVAACSDAALTYPTDVPRTSVGVCAETLSVAATTVHVELLGGLVKCAT